MNFSVRRHWLVLQYVIPAARPPGMTPPQKQAPNFPVRRHWLVLQYVIPAARQPVMTALKWQPAFAPQHAVANPFHFIRCCMMCVHDRGNAWEGRRPKFSKQAVDVRRDP